MLMIKNEPLISRTSDVEQAIRIIADNMIKTRPVSEVRYIPYKKTSVYYDEGPLGPRRVDLKQLYPFAENGDVVYVGTNLRALDSYKLTLNTEGFLRIWLNGSLIADTTNENKKQLKRTPIDLNKGDNKLIFMCKCRDGDFSFGFMPSVGIYYMWAKDYIAYVSALSPIAEYSDEEGVGISSLYKNTEEFNGEYIYPPPTEESGELRFDSIFEGGSGKIAYALTYASEDTILKLSSETDLIVFVNGEQKERCCEFALKRGDQVLIKSLRGDNWCVKFNKDAKIQAKQISTRRKYGVKWLTLGTFSENSGMRKKWGPEIGIMFTKPYIQSDCRETYWRIGEDYIRPCMESCFYSQWFYALMVGHYGLLNAADTLDEPVYWNYFIGSMRNISEYFRYMQYDAKIFGQSSFLQKSHELDNLDEIGSIGMNLSELYKLSPDSDTLYCMNLLANAMMNDVMRFDDGTFRRPDTMWADDTYMSCPFLVRMGCITGDTRYFKECVRQFKGFKKRLYMQEKHLFSHIYFTDTGHRNNVAWGRANGWVINSLSDVLLHIPQDTEGIEDLKKLYRELAEGIKGCQNEEGLWHQVLDRSDSYTETSCTGMFLLSLCRGIRSGWIGMDYMDCVKKAYNALINKKIDIEGNIYDVCMGSSRSENAEYYMELGTIENDDHGTGIILSAFCEYKKLISEYEI